VAKRTGHGLIATADEGLAIARDFAFKAPTPIDAIEFDDERGDEEPASVAQVGSVDLVAPIDLVEGETASTPAGSRRKPRRPAVDASPVS
jgi:hypothetical protein